MQSRSAVETTIANLIGRRGRLWSSLEKAPDDAPARTRVAEMLAETGAAIQALYWVIGDVDTTDTNLCRIYSGS